jgi:preprotein translocase subunit YajC
MAPQGAEGGSSFLGFLPFILIIVIMYFLMIRPQVKKQKERQKMVDALQKGDKVVTSGGIHGKITGISEDGKTIILQIDDKVKVNVDRSAVNVVLGKQNP